jgi:AcrR family transcriptional regulator
MMDGVPVQKLTPERRRQLTRQTLIEAAAEVFAQKGFYGASLEEIGEIAGFSRGAIYSNFGSKEELLFGVLDHYMDRELDAVLTAMDETGRADPVTDAAAATAAWESANRVAPSWPTLALELRLAALRNPEVRKRLADFERRNGEKVARLIEEEWARRGAHPRISARDFADISRAAVEGLTLLASIDEEDSPRYRRLVGELFVLLASAVLGPENT